VLAYIIAIARDSAAMTAPASRRAQLRAAAAFAGRKVHWTFRFTGSPHRKYATG
jgi:hypothetical protein